MISDQRQCAREIFEACLGESSPQARAAFARRQCGGDAALEAAVLDLLAAHESNGSFLEVPLDEFLTNSKSGAAFTAAIPTERPGVMIGRYKLREQIGEGGFGVVYVAEQQQPVARKVALKIIKPGMDTMDVIARFEAERQALALMDHPCVAKVLDAGATESGRPYFVMELVRGIPITDFCDGQQLGMRERLELFIDVCRAVQHAHQKGIIHRDLKPSNVMVTLSDGRPMPKVIDFGVAKALSQKLTEKTVYTAYGQLVGTPLYMSPEQAALSMNDVDTRSDVYSLGVLLYELLTGLPPFDSETLKTVGFDEFRRLLREVDPPRPSTRVDTLQADALSTVCQRRRIDHRKLSQHLRGELDWIVMRTLEKDPNRRYESASTFAADVQRYLDDEPVQARPPSAGYRFSKFVRRNKSRLLPGAVVVVALGIVAATFLRMQLQSRARESTAVRSVEASLASVRTAIDGGDLAAAEGKLGEAVSRLDFAGNRAAHLRAQTKSLQNEINSARHEAEIYEEFVRMSRQGPDQMSAFGDQDDQGQRDALETLNLYGVLSDPRWTETLERSHLTDAQKANVREGAFETLLLLADHSVRWRKLLRETSAHDGMHYLELASRFHDPTKAFYWVRMQIHKHLKNQAAASKDQAKYDSTPARTAWDWYLPGHSAGWMGDREAEFAAYESALQIQPDHFNSLFFMANRLESEKRYVEALGYYSACIAIRPDEIWLRTNRAETQMNLGNLAAAQAEYESAVKVAAKGTLFNQAWAQKEAARILREDRSEGEIAAAVG